MSKGPGLKLCSWVMVAAMLQVLSSCNFIFEDDDDQGAVAINLQGPPALPDGSYDYNLTIAFTNDIHSQIYPIDGRTGGLARQTTLMNLLRQEASDRSVGFLACNAGDNFEGTIFHELDGGVLLLQLLELMGYDCLVVGNHDHQWGVQWLYDRIAASFPGFTQNMKFLWGNVNPSRMSPVGTDPNLAQATFVPSQVAPEVIASFENAFVDFDTGAVDPALMDAPLANSMLFNQTLFFEENGIRIGVFGLDTDESLYGSIPGEGDLFLNPDGLAENLRFYSPTDHSFASDMIDYLSDPDGDVMTDDGADIIMAVTHISSNGVEEDMALANNAVGSNGRRIDVVVTGHSHTQLNRAMEVQHANGQTTWMVQAGSRGQFLGRMDLQVDTANDFVALRNVRLLQVDSRIPDDPVAAGMIEQAKTGTGGLDEQFGSPFETILAANDEFFPAGIAGESALGNLAADACRAVGNAPPHNIGLDAVVLGSFIFRSDVREGPVSIADAQAVLPLHQLALDGLLEDSIDFIDLPGGLRQGTNPATFPIPGPNLQNITAFEYMLELVYGVADVLDLIGSFLGLDLGAVDEYIAGLQWSGVEFVVDLSASPMERIDPNSIVIDGVPLVGNEGQSFRLGVNSIISRVGFPFFQLLAGLEDPVGSGAIQPFPTYDPSTHASGLVVWEGLRDHLANLGSLTSQDARVTGGRVRTVHPDLTFNPVDVLAVLNGGSLDVAVPVLNIGEIPVTDAVVTVELDPTPEDLSDNPDGYTDAATGFAHVSLGSINTGPVAAYQSAVPGQTWATATFAIPVVLAPGEYPLIIRVGGVLSLDPSRPELITANNGGKSFRVMITIP